jgi:hypothetical protein
MTGPAQLLEEVLGEATRSSACGCRRPALRCRMSPLPSRRTARSSFSADVLRSFGQDLMKTFARRHEKMRRPL